MKYCESIYQTKRRITREVMVGDIGVGGKNPIRIQSMTTSDTRDVAATVAQIKQLADAGCEIARVTVQGIKEADAVDGIKNGLIKSGYTIPLVADIHFYPPAALRVVEFADKVRINPGNFVDKRAQFKTIVWDDASYNLELQRLEEKFSPLVLKCKTLKKALRIGVNHGSLSDRIMNRYGDTPFGMCESALEFARVCRKLEFHDFIFSMKASNTSVMIAAYRLLVAKMYELGWDYPLHLGVTEAGEGEDGRVKSAIGMGALLLDGIGDTIRVSLTEDPWFEIDPCKRLVRFAERHEGKGVASFSESHRTIDKIERRQVTLGSLHRDGSVFVRVNEAEVLSPTFYADLGCKIEFGKPKRDIGSVDCVVLGSEMGQEATQKLALLEKGGVEIVANPTLVENVSQAKAVRDPFILFAPKENRVHETRRFFEWLKQEKLKIPVILDFAYTLESDDLVIEAAAEIGSLLCDGLGEGILLSGMALKGNRELAFSILQGARMRHSKTEFISCPGCGRTLFNLQKVAAQIRERTHHLPGVKIAIMGCIVNGPGEMADADFGYVGSKPGKIDLYVGKECVERDIAMEEANDKLVALIKAHGRWQEPTRPLA